MQFNQIQGENHHHNQYCGSNIHTESSSKLSSTSVSIQTGLKINSRQYFIPEIPLRESSISFSSPQTCYNLSTLGIEV